MLKSKLLDKLELRYETVSLENILDNSKADSGGGRDVNFLKYILDNRLLTRTGAVLKRSRTDIVEEYYLDRYRKMSHESDRHFLCRAIIQDELRKLGIDTFSGMDMGNMEILRSNCSYDIVTDDLSALVDIGLTPARNYFRGLTDLKVRNYLITTYFDDYMDDIIFSVFTRTDDRGFIDAVKDYEEGYKDYIPNPPEQHENEAYYR